MEDRPASRRGVVDLLAGGIGKCRQRLPVERRRVSGRVVILGAQRRCRLGLREAGRRLGAAVGGGDVEPIRGREDLARVGVADVEVEAVAGRDRAVEEDGERLVLPVDLGRDEERRVLNRRRVA